MNSFLEPFKNSFIFKVILFIAMFFYNYVLNAQVNEIPKYQASNTALHKEILKMDSIYFTAYNTCNIKTQASIYADDLEFFHDKGGLSTDKKALLEALKKNICNKVTRSLIKGSVEVYPIHDYGAIQIGYHKFYNKQEPNTKSIPSKFIVIWKKEDKQWRITKVISLH